MSPVVLSHRSVALPIAVGCCAVGGALYVAVVDPSSTGTYPVCAVQSVTGWWCPGCGLTRGVHHLFRGDVTQALGYNALVIPLGALLVLAWTAWLMDTRGRRPAWAHRAAIPAWLGLGIAALGFTILRNVPAFDALRG